MSQSNELQVPELPSNYHLPVDWLDIPYEDGEFTAALINAVYAPGGLLYRLKAVEERVGELETENTKLLENWVPTRYYPSTTNNVRD